MAMLRKSIGRHCTCQKTLTLVVRNNDKLNILFFSGRDVMTNTKQANKPAALKSPAKLKPRVAAPQAEAEKPAESTPAAEPTTTPPAVDVAANPPAKPEPKPAAAPAAKPAASKPRAARKPSAVDQTVAKHQKALAEALEKAEAISYDPPKATKAAKPAKPVKPEKSVKPKKLKLIRDSYAMPEGEYAQIAVLKKRLSGLGNEVKKSELLRCGIAVLAALNDAELKAVMDRVERIKTGRPSKK
jgi:hypothetical protein